MSLSASPDEVSASPRPWDWFWNTIGNGVYSSAALFYMALLTRQGRLEDAGIYSIAFAASVVFGTIALYSGRVCQITRVGSSLTDADYIRSRLWATFAMALAAVAFLAQESYPSAKCAVFALQIAMRGIEAIADSIHGTLQKSGRLRQAGISLLVRTVAGFGIFATIALRGGSLVGSCVGALVAEALIVAVWDGSRLFAIRGMVGTPTGGSFRILRQEFPIAANAFLAMLLVNIPKYALDKCAPHNTQALLGMLMMAGSAVILMTQFILIPYMGRMRSKIAAGDTAGVYGSMNIITSLVLCAGLLIAAIACCVGPYILAKVFAVSNILDLVKPLVIIVAAHTFISAAYVRSVQISAFGFLRSQIPLYAAACAVVAAISFTSVRESHIVGSANSLLWASLLLFILFDRKARRCKKIRNESK